MAMDTREEWSKKFASVPSVGDDKAAAAAFAKYVADRVDGKLEATGVAGDFKFQQGIFASIMPSGDIPTAWALAVQSSTIKPVGATISAEIDASSVMPAKQALMAALSKAPSTGEPLDVVLPKALHDAFKSLKAKVELPGPTTSKVPLS